jgi:hypothetical protein
LGGDGLCGLVRLGSCIVVVVVVDIEGGVFFLVGWVG